MRRGGTALLCWSALQGIGCNAILGIEPPPSGRPGALLDAGPGDLIDAGPDADGGIQEDGAVAGDSGVAPAPYSFASWPMPNSPADGLVHSISYALDSDTIVVDRVTGLRWQQTISDQLYSWQEAKAHCSELELGGASFRLPTRIELLSLLDLARVSPAIDTATFAATPAQLFWSASPYAGRRDAAWLVNFAFGTSSVATRGIDERFMVRCVQHDDDGSAGPPPATDVAGTIAYANTGITWQVEEAPGPLGWLDAVAYCAALELQGGGWRLPTVKELHLLVDEARFRPALQASMPLKETTERYWSATELARFPLSAWALSAADGSDGWFDKGVALGVRCVR